MIQKATHILSILFLRFDDPGDALHIPDEYADFQFSFWDSVLFFGSLGPDSGILFWRGWWKPYSGIRL